MRTTSHINSIVLLKHNIVDEPIADSSVSSFPVMGDSMSLELLENKSRVLQHLKALKPVYGTDGQTKIKSSRSKVSARSRTISKLVDSSTACNTAGIKRNTHQRGNILDSADRRSLESLLGRDRSKRSKPSIANTTSNSQRQPQVDSATPELLSSSNFDIRSSESMNSDDRLQQSNADITQSPQDRNDATVERSHESHREDRGIDRRSRIISMRASMVNQKYSSYQMYLNLFFMMIQLVLGWMGLDMSRYMMDQERVYPEYMQILKELADSSVPTIEELLYKENTESTTPALNRLMTAIFFNTVIYIVSNMLSGNVLLGNVFNANRVTDDASGSSYTFRSKSNRERHYDADVEYDDDDIAEDDDDDDDGDQKNNRHSNRLGYKPSHTFRSA